MHWYPWQHRNKYSNEKKNKKKLKTYKFKNVKKQKKTGPFHPATFPL